MDKARRTAAFQSTEAAEAQYQERYAKWEERRDAAVAARRRPPWPPRTPAQWLTGNKRPANGYGGSLHPIIGYGIRGVIWYQGEANTFRASGYPDLFTFMIEQWRAEWRQGDFPFYWVQLADHQAEQDNPGDSRWAELREAQTHALHLANTGQAVIIDLGEGNDIHPRRKEPVAQRLVRLALHHDYGATDLVARSPEYRTQTLEDDRIVLTFENFGSPLRTVDTDRPDGFAICGEDQAWHWASARIISDNQVEVSSEAVPLPVAVRYAWANNPRCNLYSRAGLPVTPFRTDDFPITSPTY